MLLTVDRKAEPGDGVCLLARRQHVQACDRPFNSGRPPESLPLQPQAPAEDMLLAHQRCC